MKYALFRQGRFFHGLTSHALFQIGFLRLKFKKSLTGAKIYASLIMKGLKTIDDVPNQLREEVKKLLEAQ